MVTVGVTLTAIPDVAELVISPPPEVVPIFPVPLLKVGVRVVEYPCVIVEDAAVREVAEGAATVVTVVDVEAVAPAEFVTVSV